MPSTSNELQPALSTVQRAEVHPAGVLGEFESDAEIVVAAKALRARGLTQLNAYVPRPIEELEDLLAGTRSTIPSTALVAGIFGAGTGLGVQWYCNALDFPINVGGRPPFSLPAFIPITFEIMVLFAALATFFAVFHRARLPWLAHPVFEVPGFERASVDRFWLFVSAEDARYPGPREAQALLRELGALSTFELPHEENPARTEDPTLLKSSEANE